MAPTGAHCGRAVWAPGGQQTYSAAGGFLKEVDFMGVLKDNSLLARNSRDRHTFQPKGRNKSIYHKKFCKDLESSFPIAKLSKVSYLIVCNRAVYDPAVQDKDLRTNFWSKNDDFNFLAKKAVWVWGLDSWKIL